MARANSTESNSNDVTPGRLDTPLSRSADPPSSRPAPTSAAVTSVSTAINNTVNHSKTLTDAQIWTRYSKDLNTLGRKIKYEAQAFTSKPNLSLRDRQRAAVLGIECILAYTAAFYAGDMALYIDHADKKPFNFDATWKTLVPLWRYFLKSTRDFAHLEGLRMLLGAVVHSRIAALVGERASKSNLASEELMANFRLMADSMRDVRVFSNEARLLLPYEVLSTQYPGTFQAGMASAAAGRDDASKYLDVGLGLEQLQPGCLKGRYQLPVSSDTSPIQAARFGMSFLAEWSKSMGLDYESQLKFEGPKAEKA